MLIRRASGHLMHALAIDMVVCASVRVKAVSKLARLRVAVDRGAPGRELVRLRRAGWRARLRLAKRRRRSRLWAAASRSGVQETGTPCHLGARGRQTTVAGHDHRLLAAPLCGAAGDGGGRTGGPWAGVFEILAPMLWHLLLRAMCDTAAAPPRA